MTTFVSALLFALACNLDTVLLALGFRLKGLRLSGRGVLVIAAVTTLLTAAALEVGRRAAGLLDPVFARPAGGLVLLLLGLWFLQDGLRHPTQTPSPEETGTSWLLLAAALGANNAGAGIAAGMSGVDALSGGAINFIVTFLSLGLGHWLGSRAQAAGVRGSRWALPASGLLLMTLSVFHLLA